MRTLEPARAKAILASLCDARAGRIRDALVKVTLISPHKFDAITEWMLREGIPMTIQVLVTLQ